MNSQYADQAPPLKPSSVLVDTAEPVDTDSAKTAGSSATLPGSHLRRARERRGYTVALVASRLHLSESYIEAIEANQFSRLPNNTYARGYLRTYAKLLGLPQDSILHEFEQRIPNAEQPRLSPLGNVKRQVQLSDPLVRWSSLVVAIGVLTLSLFWWRSQNTEEPNSQDLRQVPELGPVLATKPPDPVVEQAETITDLSANLSMDSHTPSVTDELPSEDSVQDFSLRASQEASRQPSSTSPLPETAQTAFRAAFSDSSWLEVRDGQDNILFTGIKQPGEELTLLLDTETKIVIGNAQAATLYYRGELLELAPFTNSRNVASLQLRP